MAPFTVAVFCDFGGVFAFREMPFDPLFEDDITPRINMLSVELVCAPNDRPRHVRSLRLLCTRYLSINTRDLTMPGVFYEALERRRIQSAFTLRASESVARRRIF